MLRLKQNVILRIAINAFYRFIKKGLANDIR